MSQDSVYFFLAYFCLIVNSYQPPFKKKMLISK